MLSKFSVRNFKGFKDWFCFDLSDVKSYTFNQECISNGTVNKALIYGHNGVGKSNLGLAIFDITLHTTDKFRNPTFYQNYLNAASDSNIAEFDYLFKFQNDSLRYKYGKKSSDAIVYESLFINDETIVDYNRENNSELKINIPGTETLNRDLSQIKISVIKYIRSNAVIADSQIGKVLSLFFSFIENMLLFWSLDNRAFQGYQTSGGGDIMKDIIDKGHFNEFKEFLRSSELDSNLKLVTVNGESKFAFDFGEKTVDFWAACSTGVRSLTLFWYWLQRVKFEKTPPSFVFIDEFDAFYHLSISRRVIKELIDAHLQVILTTHNTSLMSNDLLRPDCYFLMYKNRIGSLSKLTDKELRQAHNIEKMYRAGAFGE